MPILPPNAEPTSQTVECPRPCLPGPWRVDLGVEDQPASVTLHQGDELTLGSGRAALMRVHDPAVSSLHCRLRVVASGIFVEDLASKNGLYVGGARVSSALLSESGAAFVMGRSAVCVRTVERDEQLSPSDPLPGVIGSSAPMLRVARLVRRIVTAPHGVAVSAKSRRSGAKRGRVRAPAGTGACAKWQGWL